MLWHQGRRLYAIHIFVQLINKASSITQIISITTILILKMLEKIIMIMLLFASIFLANNSRFTRIFSGEIHIYCRQSFDINRFSIVEKKRWEKVRFILSLLQVGRVNRA
jgi:hypothetical protein